MSATAIQLMAIKGLPDSDLSYFWSRVVPRLGGYVRAAVDAQKIPLDDPTIAFEVRLDDGEVHQMQAELSPADERPKVGTVVAAFDL